MYSYYKKRSRPSVRPRMSRGKRTYRRRVYAGRRARRNAYGIQRYANTAHFPRPVVTRRLAQLSVELKTRIYGGTYTLKLPGLTGAPWYGVSNGLVPVAYPGANDTLNGISVGVDWGQREGRQVANKSIHIRGMINRPDIASGTVRSGDLIFLALVLDKECNGAPAPSEAIFSSISTLPLEAPSCLISNVHSKNRFRVLSTKLIRLGAGTIVFNPNTGQPAPYYACSGDSTAFEMYVDLKGMKTNFIDTDAHAASIVDNCLNLYAWSMFDSGVGHDVEQAVYLSYQSELRYVG